MAPQIAPQIAPKMVVNGVTAHRVVTSPEIASLWRRIAAWTVDLVACAALWVATLVGLLRLNGSPVSMLFDGTVLPFVLGSAVLSFVLLLPLVEAVAKTSVGKLLFGIGFQATTGQMLFRALAYWFELGFLGIGLLWALFDRKHRAWHDLMSDVAPVRIKRENLL